jgi:hypothetical protein
VMVLLYFLLAAGDLFLQKLVHVVPNSPTRRRPSASCARPNPRCRSTSAP